MTRNKYITLHVMALPRLYSSSAHETYFARFCKTDIANLKEKVS